MKNELIQLGAGVSRRTLLKGMAATIPFMAMPGLALAQSDPKYGGTFVVASGTEPRHLNQNITTDSSTKLISNPIFSKLVGLKSDFSPSPDLAKEWSVSEDGKTYTFKLHEGVMWHDGKPMTADDILFTFEKVLFAHHNIGKTLAPFVESIASPDANTVVFQLKSPNDVFMTFVAGQSYIQPKHLYENTDIADNPVNMAPIGTGPFKFESWSKGQEVILVRNENYFQKDRPYVDRIVTRFIPEPSARIRALEAGEIDYVTYFDLPPAFVTSLQSNPDVEVVNKGHEAWGSIVELMPNHDKAPFNDVKVRQALTHALDRKFIVDKANYGLSKVATGPVSSDIAWAYNPDTAKYPYDPDKAGKLLDEAGYPKGSNGMRFPAKIIVVRTIEANLKAAQIMAEQLRQIGVDAEVISADAATAVEAVYSKREFDLFIHSLTTGPDPAMGMQRQYISSNIRPVPYTNASGYRNPKVDELFEKAATNPQRAERAKLYKEISAILAEDAVLIWLWENAPYSAHRKAFGNLHSWAAESIYNYGDVYWNEGTEARS